MDQNVTSPKVKLKYVELSAIKISKKSKNIFCCFKQKYPLPENWMYQEARRLFIEPEVTDGKEIEVLKNKEII